MFHLRQLLEPLAGSESLGKVRILLGARQTGKTELLREIAAGPGSLVFDLQDSALRRRLEADPERFSGMVRALPKDVKRIIVDEVQRVPALLDEVQALYDANKTRFEFFLTGSSARQLRRGSANLLPGRAHVYSIFPLVRWEEGIEGAIAARPEARTPRAASRASLPAPFPERSLERRLLFGSLPGIVAEGEKTAARTLEAYVDLYLEEEIRREALVRDLGSFSTFLRLVAIESGRIVNLSKLSQESGIALPTLRNYFDVLLDTFVGHRLQPYSKSGRRRLLSTPRFYLFDLGVRNAATGQPFDAGVLSTSGGELLEHWVALELLHRARYLGRGHELSFWRTTSGAEVDFVWESPKEDLPIEVKWTKNPRVEDARHLELFLDSYPKRARRGFVVCRCERPEQLTERVTALPWQDL